LTARSSAESSPASASGEEAVTRRSARLAPAQRKRQIVEAAAEFFAEHGFDGGTAELARRLHVSQPLLYRYFSSKQDLINQVYEHTFSSEQYYARWLRELDEQDVPLRDRLVRFYCDYTDALLNPKFLRLSIWARLSRTGLNARYIEMLEREILPRIALALRRDVLGERRPRLRAQDLEFVRTLHGSIYYVALRRMHERISSDVRELVISKIDIFLDGARHSLGQSGRRPSEKRPAPGGHG
jgi:AcrR family transcriptional regulator